MTAPIDSFVGGYEFLSNFYPSTIIYSGEVYSTVEHAYQAAKVIDPMWEERIRTASTPNQAKKIGRRAPLRVTWENDKVAVMRELVHLKFRIPELRERLIETDPAELIEGNWWGDTFWGVCKGKGENMLGMLLMEERRCLVGLS